MSLTPSAHSQLVQLGQHRGKCPVGLFQGGELLNDVLLARIVNRHYAGTVADNVVTCSPDSADQRGKKANGHGSVVSAKDNQTDVFAFLIHSLTLPN